jgi:hypothetical protein
MSAPDLVPEYTLKIPGFSSERVVLERDQFRGFKYRILDFETNADFGGP